MTGNESIIRIDASGLQTLQSRPPFQRYCVELWERRFFIWADARFKALRTTKDYQLWRTWLVLQPLLDVAFYAFLFGFILKTSRGVDNFAGFLILGVVFMRMLVGLMNNGSALIRGSKGMIKTFQFPKATIPLAQTFRALLDNILPAIIAIFMALAMQAFSRLSWTIAAVIPLFLLIHVFGCGLMLITARLTAMVPDSKAVLSFIGRAWFFLSGVMFSIDRFVNHPELHRIMTANPGHIFLTAVRDSVIYAMPVSFGSWLALIAWSFGTFLFGLVYFWGAEAKYVRVV